MEMSELFEIAMVVLFGLSWPANMIKSYKARTAKGKSVLFLILVIIGYACGIISKLLSDNFKWYILLFYIVNLIMVTADLMLYFRNLRIDAKK